MTKYKYHKESPPEKSRVRRKKSGPEKKQKPGGQPRHPDPTTDYILYLQRTIGNEAVQRLAKSGAFEPLMDAGKTSALEAKTALASLVADKNPEVFRDLYKQGLYPQLQPKLEVSSPGDVLEQEADRVADKVVNMSDFDVQRQNVNLDIQTKENTGGAAVVDFGVESGIRSMKGGGQPLPDSTGRYYKARFNRDFDHVRIHTGSRANELARAINARAFTTGNDIFFAKGEYNPGSREGKKLIAHELTHVVQQKGGSKRLNAWFGAKTKKKKKKRRKKEANRYYMEFDLSLYSPGKAPFVLPKNALSFSKAITLEDLVCLFSGLSKHYIKGRPFDKKLFGKAIRKIMDKRALYRDYEDLTFHDRTVDSNGNVSVLRFKIPEGHFKPHDIDRYSQYFDSEKTMKNKKWIASKIYHDRMRVVELYGETIPLELLLRREGGFKAFWDEASFHVHNILDIVGLIPFAGDVFADGLNAGIYYMEGKELEGNLAAAAMIPFLGWCSTGGKHGAKIAKEVMLAEASKLVKEGMEKYASKNSKNSMQYVNDVLEIIKDVDEKIYHKIIRNYEDIAPVLNKHISNADLSQTSYELIVSEGKKYIRRVKGKANEFHIRLFIDEYGIIRMGVDSIRLSKAGKLREALVKALGRNLPGHQAHHLIPDQVVKESPLFREALERWIYNIDNAHNGILLPEAVEFAKKYATGNLPLHCGSHPNYSKIALEETRKMLKQLEKKYGALKQVPDDVLKDTIYFLEENMRDILLHWGKKID
ncbi:MAG: DUF4157 domain-containing protein [bacterium]|nr:DUF4157 domain-containing protein [bacterium]